MMFATQRATAWLLVTALRILNREPFRAVLIAEKTGCEQATQSTLGNVFCRCMVPNVRCQSGFVWLGEILRRWIAGKANVLCCLNSPAKSSGPWMADRARTCLAL
jgi:hypothetical protein